MNYIDYPFVSARAEVAAFTPNDGVAEYHVMIHSLGGTYQEQLKAIVDAYNSLLSADLKGALPVFRRYFLSDAANQTDLLLQLVDDDGRSGLSFVEQPPLDGTKIALWVYLQTGMDVFVNTEGLFEVRHNGYRHLWLGTACHIAQGAEEQTRQLMEHYVRQLEKQGCTLGANCIRTWFFVQNVDVNYAGMVKARNDVFRLQGLTENTHYIASTGICGRHANPDALVLMEAYAVDGLDSGQIHYLYAPTHLNPTHEYGVSFERGTYVDYGDRRQVFISGTASIDNRGRVLYSGDVRRQTLRMWENVETLLREAECTFSDMGQMIVYLRDIADYAVVRQMYEERFPTTPKVFLLAPVCRPQWLIEMECMGVKLLKNADFVPF